MAKETLETIVSMPDPDPVATIGHEPLTAQNPSVAPDETDAVVGRRTTNRWVPGPDGTMMRNRQAPTLSALEVLPARRKQLTNAEDNRQLLWVRDPAVYASFEDNIASNQEARPDFKICHNPDGSMHKRQDLVLCSYPKGIYLDEQSDDINAAREFVEEIGITNRKVPLDYSKEELRELAQRKHEETMRESRSPTSGMRLQDAYNRYSKEQTEAYETENRSFGESQAFTNEDWKALMRQTGGARSATVTIKAGPDVAPGSALAQVQARDRRNAQAKPAATGGR